ncbi:Anamorsin, partial [Spiromyces aspiralis]
MQTRPLEAAEASRLSEAYGQIANAGELAKHARIAMVRAKKSGFNVGAAAAISFGKKKEPTKTWMISVESDSEEELIDDDELLDEADKAKPSAASLARPEECQKKRKACKNCTCGLAEELSMEAKKKAIEMDNIKSSCGN